MRFSNVVIALAVAMAAICFGVYVFTFGWSLSDSHSRWAQAGDFFGGALGTIFMFATVVLMARELAYQRKDSAEARKMVQLDKIEVDVKAQIELLKVLILESNSQSSEAMANLILRYHSEGGAEAVRSKLSPGTTPMAKVVAIWVGMSGGLEGLNKLDENRCVHYKYMLAVIFSNRLCTVLDEVARLETRSAVVRHFPGKSQQVD